MSDEKSFSVCQEMLPLFRAVVKICISLTLWIHWMKGMIVTFVVILEIVMHKNFQEIILLSKFTKCEQIHQSHM